MASVGHRKRVESSKKEDCKAAQPLSSGNERKESVQSEELFKEAAKRFSDIIKAAKTKNFDSQPLKLAIRRALEAARHCKGESLETSAARCNKVGKAMIDEGVLEPLVFIFSATIEELLPTRFLQKGGFAEERFSTTLRISLLFQFLSDECFSFSLEACKNKTIIGATLMILQELHSEHMDRSISTKLDSLLGLSLDLAYNLSMRNDFDIIEKLHAQGVTTKVRPYIRSPKKDCRITALLYLIYVESEEKSVELSKNPEGIEYLFTSLRQALSSMRSPDGYSAEELLKAIEKFAVADVNKVYLRKIGIMDLIKDVLNGDDVAVKTVSLKILCQLSFDSENARIIKTDLLHLVKDLATLKPDKKVNRTLSKNAKAVLWMVASAPDSTPSDPPPPYPSPPPYSSTPPCNNDHIMISYSWSEKEKVIKIKDFLKENGFKVWIDRENITTDKYEALAAAVENAWLVLIAISRKYKESSDCRKEASYAKQLKKEIIPLKMEEFTPDGWLGFFVSDLIYHGFKNEYTPEAAGKLLVEVKRIAAERRRGDGARPPATQTDGVIRPAVANKNFSRRTVKKLDEDGARKFLKGNGVTLSDDAPIDGEQLICLADLRKSDPSGYHQCLKQELGVTSLSSITAIKRLLKQLDK